MAIKTNLAIRNKYIDLALEDCVLPLYLSKHLNKISEIQYFPNMLFKGALWEPKTIIANALAKKINATISALVFNEEPRSKSLKKGERSLTVLRLLLKKHALANEKKVFIIEDLKHFPKARYKELFEIINNEAFHRFIFFGSENKALDAYIQYYPQISFDFKIDHSPKEEEAYWGQCQRLVQKQNRSINFTELKLIVKSTYFFWVSLFGRETLQAMRKELEFIPLNPVKNVVPVQTTKIPIRLNPVNFR